MEFSSNLKRRQEVINAFSSLLQKYFLINLKLRIKNLFVDLKYIRTLINYNSLTITKTVDFYNFILAQQYR